VCRQCRTTEYWELYPVNLPLSTTVVDAVKSLYGKVSKFLKSPPLKYSFYMISGLS
jgi:hypothetical protein